MQANPASFSTRLRVLRVDASARVEGSVTRQLADLLLRELDERVSACRLPGATWQRACLSSMLPGSAPT